MNTRDFRLATGLLFLAATVSAAQPPAARDGMQATVRVSHTLESSFENVSGGEYSANSVEAGVRGSRPIRPDTHLLFGLTVARHELDFTGPTMLPNRLVAIGVPLGLMHRSSEAWRWTATVQPRYAGALRLGNAGLDVPVLAFATYGASPDLIWTFGFRYSRRSSVTLLPIIGANWKFAPDWEAKLAFPETGVFYRPTSALTLGGIIELHGGDFRVEQDPRPPGSRTGGSLNGSWLEYREIRAGASVQYAFSPAVSLRADAGYAFSQRFEYQRPDLTIEGGGSSYLAVGLSARF